MRFRFLSALIFLSLGMLCFAQTPRLREDNIGEIISSMTTQEKVDLLVGCGAGWGNVDAKFPGTAGWTASIPRLGIPSIYFSDGPLGVNMDAVREYDTTDYSCTFFLSGSTLASSWDPEAARLIGEAIGYELKERGLDIILGPGMNLHRSILGGRNQEYFSEDPLLSGKMASAWILGAQSNGVGVSLKHFAANNQETNRKENDARMSARALREIYLKGFEIAVKESKPATLMGSYNYINGVHACESGELLDEILRKEWGWDGVVMSDWDGVVLPAAAVKATCDLIEPGTEEDKKAILSALGDGTLDMEDVDRNLRHILSLIVKSPNFKGYRPSNDINRESHRELLRLVASESAVLLKNDGNVLPVKPGKVALYGVSSYDLVPGNMGVGGNNMGPYHVSLVQGLREAGFEVCLPLLRQYTDYIPVEKERIMSQFPQIYRSFYRFDRPEELIPSEDTRPKENVQLGAQTANMGFLMGSATPIMPLSEQVRTNDLAVITLARTTGEAFDRMKEEFYLTPSERELIETVSAAYHGAGKKVVVILNLPACIETASWRDKVDAILSVGQPGERAGESIADVLTGKVSPSGRLVESWPLEYGDSPADANFPAPKEFDLMALLGGHYDHSTKQEERNIDYTLYEEGIYVGYRYFTTAAKPTAYSFGFGLGYTDFSYGEPVVENMGDGFMVSVDVKNIGNMEGKEVVQLYVSAPAGGLEKPLKELKGFAKTTTLAPGESETLCIPVSLYDLASFNENKSSWETAKGTYHFLISRSSIDVVKTIDIKVDKALEWKVSPLILPKEKIDELSLK